MLERHLEHKCNKHAESLGWMHVKTDLAARGWPDRIYFGPSGQLLLVEFKRPGQKPRKQQAVRHKQLRVLGHPVSVIFSFDAFCELLSCAMVLADSQQN